MGDFVKHEPCPRCGSRDNVGVWTDGKWCFGCGYRIPGYKGLSHEDIRKQLEYRKNKKKNDPISLPHDYTTTLPSQALDWLRKYQITDDEITKHKIGWSDEYTRSNGTLVHWPSIIFPAFDTWGNLLVFQRRTCNGDGFPKYHTTGAPEAVLWTVSPGDSTNFILSIVEDFVSCIKVGRHFETTPLWGSSLSPGKMVLMSNLFSTLLVWLDKDKAKEAAKMRMRALPFFKDVVIIVTEKDPKEYSDADIIKIVGHHLDKVQ